MERLFQTHGIGSKELKNRVAFPPMVCSTFREDGYVSAENIEHYRQIAKGGVGLVIQEATCVSDMGAVVKASARHLGRCANQRTQTNHGCGS